MTPKLKIILKQLLTKNDLTSAQLARACSIPPQTLNNWLSGQNPRSLEQIKIVADYFGVTLDYLAYGILEKKNEKLEDYQDEINAGTFEVVLRRVKK